MSPSVMDHPAGFASSPWAAMLGHGMHGMHEYHGHPAGAVPMDLHVPQHFPYYRYRDDPLCWSDRKPPVDGLGHPASVNTRILELRKEKSRDAARSRRGKENYEFYELAKMLPLPAAITSQLDKASIIRLTISYLKLRDFSGHGDPPWNRDPLPSKSLKGVQNRRSAAGMALELFEQHQGTHILQSLDGFALSVAADGRFLYISETVSIYLGLSQVEMTGSSIFDYVHQADHAEIAEQLGLCLTGSTRSSSSNTGINSPASGVSEEGSQSGTNNPDVSASMTLAASSNLYKGMDRSLCVRMKSTLTKRGCHFKSSGYRVSRNGQDGADMKPRYEDSGNYRVVLLLCRLRPQYTFSHNRKSPPTLLGMVALAIALPPPSVHEIRLESDMFVTRINFDFRIAHCEPRVTELLGYTPEEMTGKNLYALCHGEDANKLRKCHLDLINKGQVLTHYYRVMNKHGGYTWIQTCATVVCNSKNADEQNVICVNYVISGREYPNLVMDCCQLEESIQNVKREETPGDSENGSPDGESPTGPPAPPGPPPPMAEPRPDESGPSHSAHTAPSTDVTQLATLSERVDKPLERPLSPPPKKIKRRKLSPEAETALQSSSPAKEIERTKIPHDIAAVDTTSVKDLENAMSKHLPSSRENHQTTDFSTDALLKQQKSTIQWIGTQDHLAHLNRQLQQHGTTMPASALLRQLYANRESVIRSNVLGNPRGYYGNDSQTGPLPTPPGSEGSTGYPDQFTQHKPSDFAPMSYSYGDYHSAMTPPGSVSPRDRHQYSSLAYDASYGEAIRPYGDGPTAPVPLKPTAFPLDYGSSLEQGQYFGGGSPAFHLYHPAHGSSGKNQGSPANWYSTTS